VSERLQLRLFRYALIAGCSFCSILFGLGYDVRWLVASLAVGGLAVAVAVVEDGGGRPVNTHGKKQEALSRALANAQSDGKPRYVHCYQGLYWVGKTPPKPSPMAGVYGGDHCVVYPDGRYETYDPTKGVPSGDADGPADTA
jgi:hypothetical protein